MNLWEKAALIAARNVSIVMAYMAVFYYAYGFGGKG